MADLTITAASVAQTSGSTQSGIAGATITAGQVVYLDSATSRLKLAQSDGTAAEVDAVGIALHASLSGQPLAYAPNGSTITTGATTAKGVAYVVSATAGGIAPAGDLVSGNRVTFLGYATDASGTLVVNIRNAGVAV